MKKIVLMISSSIGGGAQLLLYNLAQEIKNNNEVLVVCPEGFLFDLLDKNEFRIIKIDFRVRNLHIIKREILKWAGEDNFICNPFIFGTSFFACLMFRKYRKCSIFSLLLNPIIRNDQSIIRRFFYKRIAAFIGKYSEGLGSGSPELQDEIKSLTGRESYYLENRVPNDQLPRSSFYEPSKKIALKVCFVGRLTEQKRPDIMLRVAQITKQKSLPINYYVAGEGHLEDEMVRFIKDNQLNDIVSMVGFKKDLYGFLNQMDVLLCTSEFENTPLIILNAMNASLVVVAGDVVGIPHLIKNEYDGFISAEYTPESFANVLEKLSLDDGLVKFVGQNAYKKAIEDFSFNIFVNKYLNALTGDKNEN